MKTHLYIPLALGIFLLTACSTDIEELHPAISERTLHTATLRWDGNIQGFDPATRSAAEWADGDCIYIQYQTDNGRVDGAATYSASTGKWTVNYYGTIVRGKATACEVYYFENAATTASSVSLSAQCCVYADKQATYVYEDGEVTLRAAPQPLTGRIRFRGAPGISFSLNGLKWYSSYNISSNTLSQQSGELAFSVGNDGYTPYIYAEFRSTSRQITVISDDGKYISTLSKDFDSSVLQAGESGYLNVPTSDARNGWKLLEQEKGLCPDSNHPHMIDMGTGVKFACCNVGASSPIDYGDYFAWGETTSKSTYNWSTYKWCKGSDDSMTKYCNSSSYGTVDNKTLLELADDAARANWGGTWRMPTIDELEKLNSSCTWTWTTIRNVKGYKVTASNGSVLFLPAAGCRHEGGLDDAGSYGYYWSSSLHASYASLGRGLFFASGYRGTNYGYYRYDGQSVRPVTE